MTYNLKQRIEEIETALVRAKSRLDELEQVADRANWKLSDSYRDKIDDVRVQKELMEKHLAAFEIEKIQSWESSTFGNDLVKLAESMITRADALLSRLKG
jgi:hypothetical protein